MIAQGVYINKFMWCYFRSVCMIYLSVMGLWKQIIAVTPDECSICKYVMPMYSEND